MRDGITTKSGNSRYLKSVENFLSLYPNYEAFANALIAGTLPIDLNGINLAGWQQLGTELSKANLLSDETESAIFGNAADRTVDQALSGLQDNTDNVFRVGDLRTSIRTDLGVQWVLCNGDVIFDEPVLDLISIGSTQKRSNFYNTFCVRVGDVVYSVYSEGSSTTSAHYIYKTDLRDPGASAETLGSYSDYNPYDMKLIQGKLVVCCRNTRVITLEPYSNKTLTRSLRSIIETPDGSIYGTYSSTLYRCTDITSDVWENVGKIPSGAQIIGYNPAENCLYLSYGWSGDENNSPVSMICRYSLETNTYSTVYQSTRYGYDFDLGKMIDVDEEHFLLVAGCRKYGYPASITLLMARDGSSFKVAPDPTGYGGSGSMSWTDFWYDVEHDVLYGLGVGDEEASSSSSRAYHLYRFTDFSTSKFSRMETILVYGLGGPGNYSINKITSGGYLFACGGNLIATSYNYRYYLNALPTVAEDGAYVYIRVR